MTRGCYHTIQTKSDAIVVYIPMVGEYIEIMERNHDIISAKVTSKVLNRKLNEMR